MNTERVGYLLQMIREEPRDPFLKYGLALEYSTDYQTLDKAIDVMASLRKEHPEYLPLYYQLAVWFKKRGDENKAIEVAKAGKELALKQGNRHTFSELEGLLEDLE